LQKRGRNVFSFDDESLAVQSGAELLEVVDHDTADPLPAQLARHDNLVDAHLVGCDVHRQDSHEVPDQLAEEPGAGAAELRVVERQERLDGVGIGRVDRPHEKMLAFHPARTLRLILSCFYSIAEIK